MKYKGYIVGIGAAEGGISAINQLFKEIPTYTGSSFIIYLYVPQKDVKILKLTLQKHTKMPVEVVEATMPLSPNTIYIVEPGTKVALEEGKLCRQPYDTAQALKPIDTLFTMLAEHAKEKAIGIILSGAQKDGAIGVQTIFKHQGMVLLQSEQSAQFIGMLRYVAATNAVHYVAGVEQMFSIVLKHISRNQVPTTLLKDTGNETLLQEVVESIKQIGYYDVSYYKQTLVARAVRHQLKAIGVNESDKYLSYLKAYHRELKTLQEAIHLAGQGLFEQEALFRALAQAIIPHIFESKKAGELVTIWIPACGIGSVAYAILILCEAYQEKTKSTQPYVIYATDRNEEKLACAQRGIYDVRAMRYIADNKRSKLFEEHQGSYSLKPHLRQKIRFEKHDLVKDSPYEVPDMIILRDLLRDVHETTYRHVLLTLYSKITPQTYLVLETQEVVAEMGTYFNCIDKKNNIYQRGGYIESEVYL